MGAARGIKLDFEKTKEVKAILDILNDTVGSVNFAVFFPFSIIVFYSILSSFIAELALKSLSTIDPSLIETSEEAKDYIEEKLAQGTSTKFELTVDEIYKANLAKLISETLENNLLEMCEYKQEEVDAYKKSYPYYVVTNEFFLYEFLKNSYDANATHMTIFLCKTEEGNIIAVVADNGKGFTNFFNNRQQHIKDDGSMDFLEYLNNAGGSFESDKTKEKQDLEEKGEKHKIQGGAAKGLKSAASIAKATGGKITLIDGKSLPDQKTLETYTGIDSGSQTQSGAILVFEGCKFSQDILEKVQTNKSITKGGKVSDYYAYLIGSEEAHQHIAEETSDQMPDCILTLPGSESEEEVFPQTRQEFVIEEDDINDNNQDESHTVPETPAPDILEIFEIPETPDVPETPNVGIMSSSSSNSSFSSSRHILMSPPPAETSSSSFKHEYPETLKPTNQK